MKTGATNAVLKVLCRARKPLMVPDLATLLPDFDRSQISSAIGNLANQGRVVGHKVTPQGRFHTAYTMAADAHKVKRAMPKSECLLQEVWR